ncbi:hypothetical protein GCK72_020048 [Caenorhabditis remanei]|uniref:Uncharacterized protein n=1 Tax=Caenorhabditis remanei TaxID=31234 RepID=A0A6A5GFY5_CAERE|nr:hypothetical protein GCK72_020048 [Caenorhabditis remanei]KAF1753491.1 hypothetical protein GCK72_020048 [Caenorhabditis remanei]
MKFLLIGLAALQLAGSVLAFGDEGRSQFYESINFQRRRLAKQTNIANMNEIEYDRDLEKIIEKELAKHDGCPETSIVKIGDVQIFLNIQGNNELLGELASGAGRTKAAVRFTECENKQILSAAADISPYPDIHGPPGSQCPPGREPGRSGPWQVGMCVIRKSYARKIYHNYMGAPNARLSVLDSPNARSRLYNRKSFITDVMKAGSDAMKEINEEWSEIKKEIDQAVKEIKQREEEAIDQAVKEIIENWKKKRLLKTQSK